MSRIFIKTCVLLAVTSHARAQYFDFFNTFLQPPTTTRPRNDATKRTTSDTKHRQTNKQRQDIIFFETDDLLNNRQNGRIMDPFNIYPTTMKPRRKPKTTTSRIIITTVKPKSVNSNKIIHNNNPQVIRIVTDNIERPNARRIDYDNYNYNMYKETTRPYEQSYYRPTTQRTVTVYKTTQVPSRYNHRNPLLNRPGVKPAIVDENRPPITNRPITEKPFYERPVQPHNNKPSQTPRPPVNTRPPFEAERTEISTGVAHRIPTNSNEDSEIDIEIGPDEDEMSNAEKSRLYDLCEQKCTEYKSSQVRRVVALPLAGAPAGGAEVNVSTCAPDTAPLILGGQLAKIETFPHMALLGWRLVQRQEYAWKCGGSLVSEQFVLTAGHCTYHDKDSNVISGPPGAVQLGSSIYNDRSATVVRVSLVIRHPKYKLRRSYHDIALLKLAAKVTFSETIRPACLGVPPAVGEPVIATGWGKTEFGGDSSIQLRSVSIPIWDMGDCQEIWGTSLKLPNGPMPDNQICAGEKKGAKDTCQGDSGGPAQVRDGCAWRVVAVTSVGRSCGAPDTPALYARVPRAFVASQVYTNTKSERDGKNEYGNTGTNANNKNKNNRNENNGNNWNNKNVNNNNNANNRNNKNENTSNNPNNWNNRNVNTNNQNNRNNNNANNWNNRNVNTGNNWNSANNNDNTNWNTRNDNANNWNNRNNAGNARPTVSNQNRNTAIATRPTIINNDYYNGRMPSQFGSDSQSASSNNRGSNPNNMINLNNRYDNYPTETTYNQNGNRHISNAQTTNGYNQNYQPVRYPDDNSNFGNNYGMNNGYGMNPISSRPWWM